MNGPLLYAQTGRTANQLATLNAIGLFNPAITTAPSALPALPDPFGSATTLAERTRAYLHSNCSQCHRPNGGTPTDLDLRSSSHEAQSAQTGQQQPHSGVQWDPLCQKEVVMRFTLFVVFLYMSGAWPHRRARTPVPSCCM